MTFYSVSPVRFGVGVSGSTATLGINDPELGTRAVVDENEYLFVYNAGNSQIGPGYACTISAVTGYSVTVSSITATDMPLGVRLHSTLLTAYYGWVATKGIGAVNMSANESCVTGQILVLGVDGGFGLKSNATDFRTGGICKAAISIASAASGSAFFSLF
mgnify:CR=1 FL=1